MDKRYYDISYSRLGLQLQPADLRKPLSIALVNALLRPLAYLHSRFMTFSDSLDTAVNSQVCYMERMLNDRYDYYDRRIFIRDAEFNEDDYFLFSEGEGPAVPVNDGSTGGAVLWADDGKLGATSPDFVIVFPAGFNLSEDETGQLYRLVDNNKLASRKYRIIYE